MMSTIKELLKLLGKFYDEYIRQKTENRELEKSTQHKINAVDTAIANNDVDTINVLSDGVCNYQESPKDNGNSIR